VYLTDLLLLRTMSNFTMSSMQGQQLASSRPLCRGRAGRGSVRVMANRVDKFLKSDVIVSPSILSANFAKLGEQV
jgi:hypothetical protein